ncbi:probable G-protein coupled receptor 132b [Clupea harengus]|uniref:Probable G-protein coupled receptor 132b n=1 Tax=Clupea harengus TaxID=7950 RepID=A0A8M1KP97_CLUHA|nr:probable G-protein coupled receptor 132b [Clupea harengus]
MHVPTVTQAVTTGLNNSTASPCEAPYSQDRIPLVLLYSTVLVVGLPANLATVYLTFLQVRRKNVLGIYLLSLSLCDLTYLLTLPLWVVYVNSGHQWPLGSLACKVTGYIFFNNMYISIFLLCCISVDRYVAVVYAVESRGLRRQRLAAAICTAVWLVVALGHMPVFTMPEGEAGRGARHCFEPGQSTASVTGFNYARFFVGFAAPLAVLASTNRAILVNVQASTGLRHSQKEKVRYLAVAVVLLFLVCFGPYHVILLMRAITYHFTQEPCHFENCVYTPYTISLGLSTVNSAVNPILYVLSSDNIRREIARGLNSLRDRTVIRQRSSNSSQHKMNNSSDGAIIAAHDTDKPCTPPLGVEQMFSQTALQTDKKEVC